MRALTMTEVDEVGGGVNWGMVATGAVVAAAGAAAVATGGFSLLLVGNIALAAGSAWAGAGLSLDNACAQ